MRIFFTTPHLSSTSYQPYIDEILSVLRKRKVNILTPADGPDHQKQAHEELKSEKTHYAFITHSIAEADIVIVEASLEDFRIGHEVTLALLYSKPTLIVSQHTNYAKYIPHELLVGLKYKTKRELRSAVQDFLDKANIHISQVSESTQAIGRAADSLHMAALATSRHQALRDESEFGKWARLAEEKPEKAYIHIQKALGHLPVNEAWSVFAPIYNEDTPDYIFSGVARFVHTIFAKHGTRPNEQIANAAARTGALARNLTSLGYRDILAFDASREMLAEAFRLCAHLKSIKPFEADLATVQLPNMVKAIAWVDYSSNFALTSSQLKGWLQNLLANIVADGCLVFDVRTITGWRVNFFHQKVTTFATDNFQRIWINLPDYDKKMITFDIFIRIRQSDGSWGAWRREQMTERMWSLDEIKTIVAALTNGRLEAIYGDNFTKIEDDEEPGLAYIVIKKL